jgi:tetratricopeptide (TPR) repeat protein
MNDALILEPFSVPKQLEENGITPEVVAKRVGVAMSKIEIDAQTRMKKDNLTSLHDEGPDVEMPGTRLSLKTLVEITRNILGTYQTHISGDIVAQATTETSKSPQVTVTVYITKGKNRISAGWLVANSNDFDSLARETAEMILQQVNPFILAVHRYDHGEVGKAVELAQAMVANDNEDRREKSAAATLLGIVLYNQKKYADAIAEYQKAIELDPKYAPPYNNWGVVLDDRGIYDEAIAKYQRTIKLDPKNPAPYNNWGFVLYQCKRYDEATAKYQKAIELDPKFADPYSNWTIVLLEQGKYREAEEKLNKANELSHHSSSNKWLF